MGEYMQWRSGLPEVLLSFAKTEDFPIGAEHEKATGEEGARHDSAGNGAARLSSLFTKGSSALKTDETEQGKHDAKADSTCRGSFELQLWAVEMQADAPERGDDDDGDERDRDRFEPEHDARRDGDIAESNPDGATDRDGDQQDR